MLHGHADRSAKIVMRSLTSIVMNLLCLGLLLPGCAVITREATDVYIRAESAISTSEISITLKNSFIETYKHRTTIDVLLTVDKANRRPKPAFLDGDFHIAGRAPEIGLPVVAEIKNSASEEEALDIIHKFEGTGKPLRISGAWRIWPEHAGKAEEVQGEELEGFDMTNPDHVFEIHPVTLVQERSLLNSFRPVEGYIPGRPDTVFRSYENTGCRIIPGEKTTTLITRKGAFNDVEFIAEIRGDSQDIAPDGRFVYGAAYNMKGELLVPEVRMVFVKDTPPEKIVRHLSKGSRLHVFGLPRIDLSKVSSTIGNLGSSHETLNLSLPYELVIVGVYRDK